MLHSFLKKKIQKLLETWNETRLHTYLPKLVYHFPIQKGWLCCHSACKLTTLFYLRALKLSCGSTVQKSELLLARQFFSIFGFLDYSKLKQLKHHLLLFLWSGCQAIEHVPNMDACMIHLRGNLSPATLDDSVCFSEKLYNWRNMYFSVIE